jgi:hypothetical protein
VLLVPTMILAVDTWGIKGAGIAHFAIAGLVVLPVYIVLVRSMAGVSIRKLAGAVTPPFLGSVVAAGAGAAAVHYVHVPALALLAGLGVGSLVYLALVGPWLLRVLRRGRALWGDVDTNVATPTDPAAAIES